MFPYSTASNLSIGLFILLASLAGLFPATNPHYLHGLPFLVGGLFLLISPPTVRVSRWLWFLVGGYLVAGLLNFLPFRWFSIPVWREALMAHGVPLSDSVTPHAGWSFQLWLQRLGLVLLGFSLLGRRVSDEGHLWLAWLVSLGVGLHGALATYSHNSTWKPSWDFEPTFGFFANTNHVSA